MIFRPKNKENRKIYISRFFLIIGSIILILGIWLGRPTILGGIVHAIGRPIWYVERGFLKIAGGFLAAFREKSALSDENKTLKSKLSSLEVISIQNASLRKENEELQKAFGITDKNYFVFAKILSIIGTSPYDTFVISVGNKHGIEKDSSIYTLDGLVIGYVDVVYIGTSLARLYSTPGEEFAVLVGERELPAVAVGRGGGNFEIKLPRDLAVKKGDRIMMQDADHGVAGVVADIELDVTNSMQTILFRQPQNIFSLSKVLVSKKK